MIEITEYRIGLCSVCKKNPAAYKITSDVSEWAFPGNLCQPCMLNRVTNNEIIRAVLLLQSATRDCGGTVELLGARGQVTEQLK